MKARSPRGAFASEAAAWPARLALILLLAALSLLAGAVEPSAALERTGVRISKSAAVFLAHDRNQTMTGHIVYLPAGVRLDMYDRTARDDNGRRWTLALTEYGVYVYIRSDDSQSFDPRVLDVTRDAPAFAVVTERAMVDENGRITLTPSEVYRVVSRTEFGTTITLDSRKLPELRSDTRDVDVSEFYIRVFDQNQLAEFDTPLRPYRPKDVREDLARLRDTLVENGIGAEARQKVLAFLDRKLISEKDCEQEISEDYNLQAELALSVDLFLSPLKAKFGGGGSLTSSIHYPKGSAFSIRRFARDLDDGSEEVLEIRNEESRSDCSREVEARKFIISDSQSEEPTEIGNSTLQELGIDLVADERIRIRCRDEFLALFRNLTRFHWLERDIAFIFMTYYTRFDGYPSLTSCGDG